MTGGWGSHGRAQLRSPRGLSVTIRLLLPHYQTCCLPSLHTTLAASQAGTGLAASSCCLRTQPSSNLTHLSPRPGWQTRLAQCPTLSRSFPRTCPPHCPACHFPVPRRAVLPTRVLASSAYPHITHPQSTEALRAFRERMKPCRFELLEPGDSPASARLGAGSSGTQRRSNVAKGTGTTAEQRGRGYVWSVRHSCVVLGIGATLILACEGGVCWRGHSAASTV